MESLIWDLVLQLYFTIIYGQRITQIIYVALLCWAANNAMFLVFKVYVGQRLTQVIFYSVWPANIASFFLKRWICLLNMFFIR